MGARSQGWRPCTQWGTLESRGDAGGFVHGDASGCPLGTRRKRFLMRLARKLAVMSSS